MTPRIAVSAALLATPLLIVAETGSARAALAAAPPAAPGPPTTPQGEDIRDIHGPIAIALPTPMWWYWAGAGVVAGILVTTALVRRRRPKPIASHVRALAALAGERALLGKSDRSARDFSIAVSETVRGYVEEAFRLRAAHRTTEEFLTDLMQDKSPVASHRVELAEFLRSCDLAKFAGWSPERSEMTTMLDNAEAFVRATSAPRPREASHPATLQTQGAT